MQANVSDDDDSEASEWKHWDVEPDRNPILGSFTIFSSASFWFRTPSPDEAIAWFISFFLFSRIAIAPLGDALLRSDENLSSGKENKAKKVRYRKLERGKDSPPMTVRIPTRNIMSCTLTVLDFSFNAHGFLVLRVACWL